MVGLHITMQTSPVSALGKLALNTTRVHVPTLVMYKLFYCKWHIYVWVTRAWVALWFMGRERKSLYPGAGPIDTC